MRMATDDLVAALAADLRPVRRIAPVWWRTLVWLLISLPAVGLVAWQAGLRSDLAARFMETRFLLTEIAALLTALSGCYAALCAALPDQPGWKLALPLAPLALWLGTLGVQCWDVFLRLGPAGLALSGDAMCLSAIAEGGLAPALVMVVLLRRGGGISRDPRLSLRRAGGGGARGRGAPPLSSSGCGDHGHRLAARVGGPAQPDRCDLRAVLPAACAGADFGLRAIFRSVRISA